eukprot:TRINITY_DN9288_c0_g1_i3.p2 TRINITY_DN9288_c0_g1~~TRINITY_DN9288_c0_g1_i3.p2  ORF type:complete len:215 (-),score=-44.50 TRINITY_DN9288_c0_g1_i3:479-1123(-)
MVEFRQKHLIRQNHRHHHNRLHLLLMKQKLLVLGQQQEYKTLLSDNLQHLQQQLHKFLLLILKGLEQLLRYSISKKQFHLYHRQLQCQFRHRRLQHKLKLNQREQQLQSQEMQLYSFRQYYIRLHQQLLKYNHQLQQDQGLRRLNHSTICKKLAMFLRQQLHQLHRLHCSNKVQHRQLKLKPLIEQAQLYQHRQLQYIHFYLQQLQYNFQLLMN